MDAGAPLVGRDAELDWLVGWAYRSRTRALLVRGEPGIGKTRLVSELIERARLRRTPRVLVGRSAALASESLPFAALTEILRGLLEQYDAPARSALLGAGRSALAHLLPELSTQPPAVARPAERLQLFEAVRDLLVRYSETRPTLVVVEDVQWMSGSGLQLLGYLLRADLAQVRFVITARDADARATELARLVTEGVRARLLDVLVLGPLSLLAVQQLSTRLLGRAPPLDVVERIHRLSGGNPFFVEELTRAQAAGGGGDEGQVGRLLTELLPESDRALSDDARVVVQALATAAAAVPHAMLLAVTDLAPQQLEDAVREVLQLGMVEVTLEGVGYQFRHELARQACYDALLPADRIRLHRACAQWLASQAHGGSGELGLLVRLAHHWECAGEQDAAMESALAAADVAEGAGAALEAFELSRRAYRLCPRASRSRARRVQLALRAARLGELAGRHAAALELVEQARLEVDPVQEPLVAGVLEERSAWYRLLTLTDPIPVDCRRALELIPAWPPTPERVHVLATHSRLLALSGRLGDGERAAQDALAAATALRSDAARASALISLGAARAARGDPHTALDLLWQGCELARASGHVDDLVTAYLLLLLVQLLTQPDVSLVLDLAALGNEVLGRRGLQDGRLDLCVAVADAELGRWPQAQEVAQRLGGAAGLFAQCLLALLAVRRGEEPPPEVDLPSPQRLGRLPALAAKWCGEWLAEIELLQGRPAQAAAVVAQVLHRLAERPEDAYSGRLLTLGLRAHADRATAGRDAADADLVADATAAAEALSARAASSAPSPLDASRSPAGTARADALTWEAEWSRLVGASRPEVWGRAVEAWLAASRPYFAAYTLWRQAEALLAERARRRDVGPVVLHGLELARDLGAAPLHRALERLAVQAHLPLLPAAEPRREVTTARPGALTRRELDVLRLAAQGLSNRAIAGALVVSPKTVDTHMSHVLMKLDVHDRIAAASRAQRLGLLD